MRNSRNTLLFRQLSYLFISQKKKRESRDWVKVILEGITRKEFQGFQGKYFCWAHVVINNKGEEKQNQSVQDDPFRFYVLHS
jgi:hypothetical protein